MKILVTGGTGTVGSQLVQILIDRGIPVRVMTRSPEKEALLPSGAEGIVANLSHPSTLPAAFAEVSAVYLLTPLAEDEVAQGIAAIEAARQAGVERVVFHSVHRAEHAPHVPHFATKVEIAGNLAASGVSHAIIAPNSFFQNDLHLREPLTRHGIYASPIGSVGLNAVDVRDIAEAAANALLEDGHAGRKYALVGRDVITGESAAATWAKHLGREVRYAGDDLEAWAGQARQMLPEWLVRDLMIMYEHFQQEGLLASEDDLALQREVLKREPRTYDSFVAQTAAAWRR